MLGQRLQTITTSLQCLLYHHPPDTLKEKVRNNLLYWGYYNILFTYTEYNKASAENEVIIIFYVKKVQMIKVLF